MAQRENDQRRLTILLAEEDDVVRELFARDLIRGGYRVVELEDALELLDYVELTERYPTRVQSPAVIVSDEELPGMSGLEACRRVGRHYPTPPFILLSRRIDRAAFHEAYDAGVSEVIDRSDPPQVLTHTVALFTR